MDEIAISQYITDSFAGVEIAVTPDGTFFFTNPERKFPFATLVSSDAHDKASDLERPGVFRLNIGVSRETYREMFGPQPAFSRDGGIVTRDHDFTALDQIMPHPVYAPMSWVCVLNPGKKTLETMKALLAEAYERDAAKHAKGKARSSSG